MPTLTVEGLKDFIFLKGEDYVNIYTETSPGLTDNLFLEYWIYDAGSVTEEYHGYLTFEQHNIGGDPRKGKATLRLNDILEVRNFIPPASTIYPDPAAYSEDKAFFSYKQYEIRYREWSGDPPAAQGAIETSATFTCIWGGLPKDAFQNDYFTGGDTLQILHPYLKWKETNAFRKPVRPDQPDYLYYWTDGVPSVSWKCEAHYTDGVTETFDISTFTPDAGQVYWMTAGPRNLGILEPVGDYSPLEPTLVWYRLYEENTGKGREFVLDHSCVQDEMYLLFDNGLGGMNTIAMTGEWMLGGDVEKSEFRKMLWQGDSPAREGEIQSYNIQARDTLKLNSGYISKDYAIYLRQLLAGDVWFIRYQNSAENEFLKYNVQPDQISFEPRGDLWYIEIELKSSFVSPNLITI